MQAAGYNYVNIDDCYAEKNRTASGHIIEGTPFVVGFKVYLTSISPRQGQV